jgi:hypothetical protein
MDYTQLKREALQALCAERGIKGTSHKTKGQMVSLLGSYDAELEDLRRTRERRKVGKKPAVPLQIAGKRRGKLENLEPAVPLRLVAAAAIAEELSETARIAAEQAQMIAADADVAESAEAADAVPVSTPQPTPNYLLKALLRHYWNYPLLTAALLGSIRGARKQQHMLQEGQVFPLIDQPAVRPAIQEKLNLLTRF